MTAQHKLLLSEKDDAITSLHAELQQAKQQVAQLVRNVDVVDIVVLMIGLEDTGCVAFNPNCDSTMSSSCSQQQRFLV